jgi:hypothetical protein
MPSAFTTKLSHSSSSTATVSTSPLTKRRSSRTQEDPRPPLKWDPAPLAEAYEWAKVLAQRERGLNHPDQKNHGEALRIGGVEKPEHNELFAFTLADAARSWIDLKYKLTEQELVIVL